MQDDEQQMIESMQLALQAQEEIKQQLLNEISALQGSTHSQRSAEKSLKFYKSSLERAQCEKKSLEDQISKFKNIILPEISQQYERVHQKREGLEMHIKSLKGYRDEKLLLAASNPEVRDAAIGQFINNLQTEITNLTNSEEQLKEKTAKAKTELHALHEQYMNSQRESMRKIWENELAIESGINKSRILRRRSHTINNIPLTLGKEMPMKKVSKDL